MAAAAATLEALRADPRLAPFVDGDDAADTSAFTSKALGSSSAATATHALAEGIQQLELALRSEVVSKHTELLHNLTRRARARAGGGQRTRCTRAKAGNTMSARAESPARAAREPLCVCGGTAADGAGALATLPEPAIFRGLHTACKSPMVR